MSLNIIRGERPAMHDKEESRVDKMMRWLRIAVFAVREGFNLVKECLEIKRAFLELQRYNAMVQRLEVVEKGLSDDPRNNAMSLMSQVQSINEDGRRLNNGRCASADERFDYAAGAAQNVNNYIQFSSGGRGDGDMKFPMDLPRGNGLSGGSQSYDHTRAF